ncbi:MAG TPA: ATP-binding cassette domain-containing protein [Verrucomicrobiae bacterium]|jgi:ABC-type Fe3+/spermidine/putrescine transport system ATPase subunit|nr:ATP-binding cassette domain-containing protein [Verrucomicrobiae bacterium]
MRSEIHRVSADAARHAVDRPPRTPEALLSIRQVVKQFAGRPVLCGISLEVAAGEFLTILGESGSGKTTLLRLIAGFEQLDGGEIRMEGERLDQVPAYRRQVNTVFQSYAIFPHLSVFENVAYGLRAKGARKSEIPERVIAALAMVKMEGFAQSAPVKLSGGQQQRVALARALVNRPRVLLLDEPLSALDANLRRQMQIELKSLQREVGITFIFVTHDQEEAMALSDRIALLRAGRIEQVAGPREIYGRPLTAYAAEFIGQTNLLRAEVRDGMARAGSILWRTLGPPGEITFSLRPEAIRIVPPSRAQLVADRSVAQFRGRVRNQTFGGAMDVLEIDCGDAQFLRARVPSPGPVSGEMEFEFAAADAIRLREGSDH